jgi:hypothetical protein
MKEGSGVARKEASYAFTKLCLYCLKDKKVDNVVANFIRFLILPLRAILREEKKDMQTIVNAAQIIAARCASQSYDKTREPDEVVLFAENGLFEDLGVFLEKVSCYFFSSFFFFFYNLFPPDDADWPHYECH